MLGCKSVGACAVGLLALTVGTECLAQPMPYARRGTGILVSDTTLDTIYLLRDLDGNGSIETATSELTVYFSAANASGLAAPTGGVNGLFQAADGTVYITDNDTKTWYACRDMNGDGDAQDEGEARVWFNVANAGGLTISSPQSSTADATGAIYMYQAAASGGTRAIYRGVDLNGDGDANDLNETTLWMDVATLVPTSSGGDICFVGDALYLGDLRGGSPDGVVRARDGDHNNLIDATEFTIFAAEGAFGFLSTFSCATDGTHIFVHEQTGTDHPVFELTDINGSGTLDDAAEIRQVWNTTAMPAGVTLSTSFALAVGVPGTMALSGHGADASDLVLILRDGNGDNDYLDSGETTVLVQGVAGTSFPENVRQLFFYGGACKADFNSDWTVTIDDLFLYFNAYFLSDPKADVNGLGGVTIDDLFLYINLWFTGC